MAGNLENIVSSIQEKLVIGEHDSIIVLGAKSQNDIKESSKNLSKILLEGSIDLDIAIADVVRNIESFCEDPLDRFNFFPLLRNRKQKLLHRRYAEAVALLDKVSLYFKLQQAQLLKELKMLEYICKTIATSKEELNGCIEEAQKKLDCKNDDKTLYQYSKDLLIPEQDISQWYLRLERRLVDLKTSYMISMQNEEQVKLLTKNNQVLLDKISSAITNTVPIWQTQMSLTLGVELLENRLRVQEKVMQITEEHLAKSKTVKVVRKKGKNNSIDIEKVLSLNHRLKEALLELEEIEKDDEEIRSSIKKIIAKGCY